MDLTLIFWALLAGVSLVALVFGYIEYQNYLIKRGVYVNNFLKSGKAAGHGTQGRIPNLRIPPGG
jgi:uncharacterized membrane protein